MINIFITIVCEAFKEVRSDIRKSGNELEIMDYFKTKYENWRRNGKTDRSQVSSEKYLDISQKLPQNVDRLIHNLAKVLYNRLIRLKLCLCFIDLFIFI